MRTFNRILVLVVVAVLAHGLFTSPAFAHDRTNVPLCIGINAYVLGKANQTIASGDDNELWPAIAKVATENGRKWVSVANPTEVKLGEWAAYGINFDETLPWENVIELMGICNE